MNSNFPPKLEIRNPSPYRRQGHLETPWEPILKAAGIHPDELVLIDSSGRPLRAQVDLVDPEGANRERLVFILNEDVAPGEEDYSRVCADITLHRGNPVRAPGPRVEVYDNGFRLVNNRLNIWVNLGEHDGLSWFAGAASSVILDGREVLDAFQDAFLFHDMEKRCMQIDRVRFSRPAWEWNPFQEEDFHSKPFELLHSNSGPVRASVTIASQPFDYNLSDPQTGELRGYRCRLYRIMSLYAGADYLIEDVYVRGEPKHTQTGTGPIYLSFAARYFCYMAMGLDPVVTHHRNIPDWLSIGCRWDPHQGYGFATDVHAEKVRNPHPHIPLAEAWRRDRSFSWELGPGIGAKCLHLFRFCPPVELTDETGRAWYNHIFKPLVATIWKETA